MTPEFATSVCAVLALITALVSLYFCLRSGSLPEVTTQVRQLALDVTELYDKVEHWTRRDRVRKLREGQEAARQKEIDETTLPAQPANTKARKAQLRAKLFGRPPAKDLQ